MSWSETQPLLWDALKETLQMVGWSALFTVLIGLPIGPLLVLTDKGGLLANVVANKALGTVVNVGRSLPFIILLIAITPFTRAVMSTTIGVDAAIVPLAVGAIPFFARLVETAVREVDKGLVEASQAMGASHLTTIGKVLLPESLPALVAGLTTTVIVLLGYSAMAGAVGGGGLGDLAVRYGYQRFENGVMIATVVLLVVLVQIVQWLGDFAAKRLAHR